MKIKKYNNLWMMGLIICCVILIGFYILKIFFPQIIIGVAETPAIVKFGQYVDSHKWAYYIFVTIVSYIGGFFYYTSCCRRKRLGLINTSLLLGFIGISYLLQVYEPILYTPFNYVMFIILPFLMLLVNKNVSKETFTSTVICFTVDIMAQALSLCVRNIVMMSTQVNSATLTILLIDTWIWRIILYCYFNAKNKKEKEII